MSEVEDGFQLKYDLQSEAVPKKIGWCVPKSTLDQLTENSGNGKYLYVLLIVIDPKQKERRYIFPFRQEYAWVYFYRPGPHELHATLVTGSDKIISREFLSEHHIPGTSIKEFEKKYFWNGELRDGVWVNAPPYVVRDYIKSIDYKKRQLNKQIAVLKGKIADYIDPEADESDEINSESDAAELTARQLEIKQIEKHLAELKRQERIDGNTEEVARLRKKLTEKESKKASLKEKISFLEQADYGCQRELDPTAFQSGDNIRFYGHCRREVVIPEGCFAKEPPAWIKSWINFGFSTPLIDECHGSWRTWYAFSLKPFLVLSYALFLIFTRAAVAFWQKFILLKRGIRPSPIWHPFAQSIDLITLDEGPCWLTHRDQRNRRRFGLVLTLFKPLTFILATCIITMLNGLWGMTKWGQSVEILPLSQLLLLGVVVPALLGVTAIALYYLGEGIYRLQQCVGAKSQYFDRLGVLLKPVNWSLNHLYQQVSAWHQEWWTKKQTRKSVKVAANLQGLTCDGLGYENSNLAPPSFTSVIKRAPVSNIPSLLVSEIKAARCLPYAEE